MKRQRWYGDNLDSGGEKSGGKEWGRRDQDGSKIRYVKNLDAEGSDRPSYRRSYSSKLETGRSEDRDGRSERRDFSPEAYHRKEHLDYRMERKGFNRVESVPKLFGDSSGERSHRSSSNGFSSPSSSSSFRREYYDMASKAKGFRSKRDDSTWRRSSSKERKGEGGVGHVLPRVSSLSGKEIGVGSEDRGSVASASAVETRKAENVENSSSEMEEGELERETEAEAVASESLVAKKCDTKEGETNEQKEFAPETTAEGRIEAMEKEKSESTPMAKDKSEHVTTGVVEDHGRIIAGSVKQGEEKTADGKGNVSDESGKSLDGEIIRELRKEEGAFLSRQDEQLSETSFDEAVGSLKRNQSCASLLQDLNEEANEEGPMLDAESIEDDQGNEENGDNRKQSEIVIPGNFGTGVLAVDAKKLVLEEVGGSCGTMERASVAEYSGSCGNKVKEVAGLDKWKLVAVDVQIERDLLVSDRSETHLEEKNGTVNMKKSRSMMSFELFAGSTFAEKPKKLDTSVEKHKIKNWKVETLQLSLGLPDVSPILASPNLKPDMAPSSSRTKSEHSLPTNSLATHTSSDGFAPSISMSGSQPFVHNPSCSLTQNSLGNYERSVGSNPIFQGVDQSPQGSRQGQSPADQVHGGNSGGTDRFRQRKEVPLYQRILQSSNGAFQPLNNRDQSAFGLVNGNGHFQEKFTVLQRQHVKSEGSLAKTNGLERQSSFIRERPEHRGHEVVQSPTQSVGNHETRSRQIMYDNGKRWLERDPPILQSNVEMGIEQLHQNAEKFISDIVSEPVAVMARRLQEMSDPFLLHLKENMREMIINENLKKRLNAFQDTLRRRTDLSMETLSNSHRVLLEILVALKTGLQAFLWQVNNVPPSDLVEIFFNLKCRNLACRNILPVDDCDCKICSQKNGFCNACMCLVCLKFDLASNTCSWVGCDVCLHWCHTDCGLRDSHIRNGRSITGTTTEMQFHCVACNHPSEMFGFVKEVFKICAKDWNAETLSKELEYVRRIFLGSVDARGRQMQDVADQMLAHLENKGSVVDVYNVIMAFLTEAETDTAGPSASVAKDHYNKNKAEASNGLETLCKVPSIKTPSLSSGMFPPPDVSGDVAKQVDFHKLHSISEKPVVDELECLVRMKQAEAQMFQTHADDARRESEGLKRIAVAKREKIEEEYPSRIAKLRLTETEQRRRQKFEELKALKRAHQEYFNMKLRMEADIKDLLLKMEATKQNLST